jgi:WbqC-like protein
MTLRTLAVLQPGFLPWLGFFDQMARSDVFVYYDDVQFNKHGWRNRNRIKTPKGPAWVTVPVLHSGLHGQVIKDVLVDNSRNWARKLVATISQNYAHAPFREPYVGALSDLLLGNKWARLADLDIEVSELMRHWLDITTTTVRSSELDIGGGQTERLVALCRHFGVQRYLSGDAAQSYLQQDLFDEAGISVVWHNYKHPRYPQLHGEFLPYLSALDMILNLGPQSASAIRGRP